MELGSQKESTNSPAGEMPQETCHKRLPRETQFYVFFEHDLYVLENCLLRVYMNQCLFIDPLFNVTNLQRSIINDILSLIFIHES